MTDVATVTINDTCFELRYSIKEGENIAVEREH